VACKLIRFLQVRQNKQPRLPALYLGISSVPRLRLCTQVYPLYLG
jgi:hypothetical protein